MNHTPGPWHIAGGAPGQFETIRGDGVSIAHVLPVGQPTAHANAKLMSKAPEMKEVLKGLLRAFNHTQVPEEEQQGMEEMGAAIQRAIEIMAELGELGDLG